MERELREPVVIAVIGGRGACDGEQLERALDSGATRLLVDLSQTPSLTTPALNALLQARHRLLARAGKIAVVVPQRLRRLFELMVFDRRFLLAHDRLEAVQLLGVTSSPGSNIASTSFRRAA
jgi:anti-anti-sigma regulatory factor